MYMYNVLWYHFHAGREIKNFEGLLEFRGPRMRYFSTGLQMYICNNNNGITANGLNPGVMSYQGIKLTFFSSSHLAPKYFKVVANYKSSTFTRSLGKV